MKRVCPVCARIGCTAHDKGTNTSNGDTSWGGGRDRATQRRFRAMLMRRDGAHCRLCGMTGVALQAHHDTATDGRMLCNACHREVDDHAR